MFFSRKKISENLNKIVIAPGRNAFIHHKKESTLYLSELLLKPVWFWENALNASIFQMKRTWIIHGMNLFLLMINAFANSHKGILGYFFLSTCFFTLSLLAMILSTAAFFAFDTLIDSWEGLKHSSRFIFCISPILLFGQVWFLIWSRFRHPNPMHYFIVSILPFFYCVSFLSSQSRNAFAVNLNKSISFAIITILPWFLFMTGAMFFLQ